MSSGITVVITSIPERADMLQRAVHSAARQEMAPDGIIVVFDNDGEGAAVTRTRALLQVKTPWVAFLDDDDELYPHHLGHLMGEALYHEADMVFPWFDVVGGSDPFPANEHREFDVENPHQITVTVLCKTLAAVAVNGFLWPDELVGTDNDPGTDAQGHRAGEEFQFAIKLARAGYKIKHLDERTWIWHHHSRNTMGLPSRRQERNERPLNTFPGPGDPGIVGFAT